MLASILRFLVNGGDFREGYPGLRDQHLASHSLVTPTRGVGGLVVEAGSGGSQMSTIREPPYVSAITIDNGVCLVHFAVDACKVWPTHGKGP